MASGSDEPVHLPPVNFEPRRLGSTSPLVIKSFPCGSHIYHTSQEAFKLSIWAPFHSQCDWEIACWAKMCGPTSSALADLLAIPEVVDHLGLSYRTPKQLNEIIDGKLPGCPPFQCHEIIMAGEHLQFYFCDILQSIRSLFGDPEFAHDMVYAPECHYANIEWSSHVYSEMHTGDWWWAVQTSLEGQRPGTTVVPIIISSVKTQLTLFRGKVAYPVYLTIGNIPKAICCKPTHRVQMLIAYIPTSCLEDMGNQTTRRCALGNVYHFCMRNVLAPIASYGEMGVDMLSRDGIWCCCHPILAVFVGDYPEQALITCTYQALTTFHLVDGDVHVFHLACHKADLKPVFHPLWEALPLVNIFISITPDILHQMLQGVMKHLIVWCPVPLALHCKSLPPNHHIMMFAKGISIFSRVTGLKHKQMCKILLGLLINLSLPSDESPARIIKCMHALLDFLYLAQLPSHTSETLIKLEDALVHFHANKDVFINLGICDNFHFPKIHSLLHYHSSITLFGTTDNYNTEQTKHLHMDYTKWAYHATNKKDEEHQMTVWNEHCKEVEQHAFFVAWQQQAQQLAYDQSLTLEGPPVPVPCTTQMALNPMLKAVSFDDLTNKYRAWDFQDAITDFITQVNHPDASTAALKDLAKNTLLPFQTVPVFHKIKYLSTCDSEVINTVHVWPEQSDVHGNPIPLHFNTVIIQQGSQAQVVVFQLPSKIIPLIFPSLDTTWFSPIPMTPDRDSSLYKVSCIIPVDSIL
ncbi:hypothetical protein EI94DRAFT_1862395 [Lactarius quietus]|nr:hypothetical protein EI94DRAFT_1862395 [Lactarius quietus]